MCRSGLQYLNRSDEQKVWTKTLGIFAPPWAVRKFGQVWDKSIRHGKDYFTNDKAHDWPDFQKRPGNIKTSSGSTVYVC
jgi:hypothetical protein